MKKKLMTVLALVLVIALSVAGTYAYLTSQDSVVNTFTVGNVKITLDEAKVDQYGETVTPATRVDENTYKLVPGHTYTKDPTIHVDSNSEKCWLFAKIENGLGENATITVNTGWSLVTGTTNVYAYSTAVEGGNDVVVFNNFTFKPTANPASYKGANITVTAYAVQSDGFNDAAAAWAATFGAPTT